MNTNVNVGKGSWLFTGDKKIDIQAPHQFLSFDDLKLLPEFRLALMRQDTETFERILYENGLDVSKGYNVEHCLHRSRVTNKVNDCFRVVSTERTDKLWLSNSCASLDAHIYSTKDRSLQMELAGMNPAGCLMDSEFEVEKGKLPEQEMPDYEPKDEDDEEEEELIE